MYYPIEETSVTSLLSAIPFYKEAKVVTSDPKKLIEITKSKPEITKTAVNMLKSGNSNPEEALKNYSQRISETVDNAKSEIGEEKFVKQYMQKDYLDVQTYSTYLYYKLVKETKMKKVAAFITTILCTSVGSFWTILSLGRYKFSKQLADKLVDRIKRRGLTLQTLLTIGTISFQVGLIVLMQVFLALGSVFWAIKSKSVLKGLASLLYLFIASITALVMLAKSGYGAAEGKELVSKISSIQSQPPK